MLFANCQIKIICVVYGVESSSITVKKNRLLNKVYWLNNNTIINMIVVLNLN